MKTVKSILNRFVSGLTSICITLQVFLLTSVPAFADNDVGDISSTIVSPIKSGLLEVYKVLTAIVLPIAVIAIVVCGIKIIWGNDKSAESAKAAIVRIVIALMLIYLAPLIISTISGWFSSYSTQGGIFS